MGFHSLFDWLSDFDPRQADAATLQAVVSPALADLRSRQDPRLAQAWEQLEAIQSALESAREAGPLLEDFYQNFGDLRHFDRSVVDQLQCEILALSARLPSWEWNTETFAEACLAGKHLEAGRTEEAEAILRAIEERMTSSWTDYQNLAIEEHEITAEAVVGHRLLEQGQSGWRAALATMRQDPASGLDQAEAANRILVAVQKYCQRFEQHV